MPATLHASLSFTPSDIEDLLREHVESQGYHVEDVQELSEQGWDVQVRPMTSEELALHDLPTTTLEDRLQEKLDALSTETAQTFAHFKDMLDKQARDAERALKARVADLQDLTESARTTMQEIESLAAERSHVEAFTERFEDPPSVQAPMRATGPVPVEEETWEAPGFEQHETLSFADAAASLSENADANNPNEQSRQRRFQALHKDLEREARDAERRESRESIPGESNAFPADLATR